MGQPSEEVIQTANLSRGENYNLYINGRPGDPDTWSVGGHVPGIEGFEGEAGFPKVDDRRDESRWEGGGWEAVGRLEARREMDPNQDLEVRWKVTHSPGVDAQVELQEISGSLVQEVGSDVQVDELVVFGFNLFYLTGAFMDGVVTGSVRVPRQLGQLMKQASFGGIDTSVVREGTVLTRIETDGDTIRASPDVGVTTQELTQAGRRSD